MSKYRVHVQPENISKPEKVKEVIALNRQNAEEIVKIFDKKCTINKVVRVGTDQSTEKDLMDIVDVMYSAIREGNEDIYEQQRKAFEGIVQGLKARMNVVSWQKTKQCIPEMPTM